MRSAPVAMAILDRRLRYVFVNKAMAEISGRSVAEHLGRSVDKIVPHPAARIAGCLRNTLETGNALVGVEVSEERPDAPEKQRWWWATCHAIRRRGRITGTGLIITETTAERRAQEERTRSLRLQEMLMGVLGHDLRSPLMAIDASAAHLLNRFADDPAAAGSLVRIQRCTRRMASMISQLLDYTRIRVGGGIPLRCRRADLRKIAADVLDECRASHPGCTVRLSVVGRTTGGWDPDRLAQVVSNLTTNALAHGDPRRPVRVAIQARPRQVVLDVHNSGPPIPASQRKTLFQPFRGADERPQVAREGLGLGLYISKAIVDAHSGDITFTSSATRGTHFRVTLPRQIRPA